MPDQTYRGLRLVDEDGDIAEIKEYIDLFYRKAKFCKQLQRFHTIHVADQLYDNGVPYCGEQKGGRMKISTNYSNSCNWHTFRHEVGHMATGGIFSSEDSADDWADSWDDEPYDPEPEPVKTQTQIQPVKRKPMALFPFLNPTSEPEPEPAFSTGTGQAIDRANGISPYLAPYLDSSGYSSDLNLSDPTLNAANQALAQRHLEVAAITETDKIVGELVKLDEAELQAKTSLHETLSKHQQFVAKNQNLLQSINQAHVLGMAGHNQTQQVQQAKFNGLVAARSAIAARMRG